jgi:hypothetical protein
MMVTIPVVDTLNTSKPLDFTPQTGGFTMLPRDFIRHRMQDLSGAELKVMLYIIDHTLGYCDSQGQRKTADAISRSQFLFGIKKTDGTIIDRGAGVSDRSLDRALDGLEKRGLIKRQRQLDPSGRFATTLYELNLKNQPNPSQPLPTNPTNRQAVSLSVATVAPVSQPSLVELPPQSAGGYPAELRPTTPAKMRDTIENYQERIKQNTLTPSEVTRANVQDTCVCVNTEKLPEPKAENEIAAQPAPNSSTDPEVEKITAELVQARISKQLAEELAAIAVANGHRQGYVVQTLAYIAEQKQVKSREGLLVHLIKTNWLPTQTSGAGGYAQADATYPQDYQADLVAKYGEDIVRCLPKSVKPENLSKLLEIEERNLREACSQRERLTAQARLERYRLLGKQMGLVNEADSGLSDNVIKNNINPTSEGGQRYATVC